MALIEPAHHESAPILALTDLPALADLIAQRRNRAPADRALLVGVSGIDGSGKGHFAALLAAQLHARGLRAANINIDGWLALPDVRFSPNEPARHFYERGLRLDEMFDRLVLPLRQQRSVSIEADFAPPESNATQYRLHRYEYRDVDVIVLEGIFLFKRQYRDHHDLRVWIDCSFETALERALARNQEGLPPDEIMREYDTIYFPAQRLHAELDRPRESAEVIVLNDLRLERQGVVAARAKAHVQ